jgi:hypothetical protein
MRVGTRGRSLKVRAVVVSDLVAGECWLETACRAWQHPLKPPVLGMEVDLLVESEMSQILSWFVPTA